MLSMTHTSVCFIKQLFPGDRRTFQGRVVDANIDRMLAVFCSCVIVYD